MADEAHVQASHNFTVFIVLPSIFFILVHFLSVISSSGGLSAVVLVALSIDGEELAEQYVFAQETCTRSVGNEGIEEEGSGVLVL